MPAAREIAWERKGECIICTSHKPNDMGEKRGIGYFRIRRNGRMIWLHRAICERRHGPLAKEQEATHSCDNRLCINPDHIFPGTHAQNMQEAVSRKRMRVRPGTKNLQSKLTEAQATEIFHSKEPQHVLASKFGVNRSTIARITLRIGWKHIT